MGKFAFGLIIGLVLGVLALTNNPDLLQDLRVRLADLTAQVMRSAGETAEDIGDAADGVTEEVEPPATTEPPATDPPATAEPPPAAQP